MNYATVENVLKNLRKGEKLISAQEAYTRREVIRRFPEGRIVRSAKRARFLRKRGCSVERIPYTDTWRWWPGTDVKTLFVCPVCGGNKYEKYTTEADTSHGSWISRSGASCSSCNRWSFVWGYSNVVHYLTPEIKVRCDASSCIFYTIKAA